MIWSLRVRRVGLLTSVLTAYVAVLWAVGEASLPLPSFLSGMAFLVPVADILPLGLAVAVLFAIDNDDSRLARLASRPMWLLDSGYILAVVILAVGASAALAAIGLQPHGYAAGRNLVGFVGLSLVLRAAVGGRAASGLVTAFVVVSLMFGAGSGGLHPWAWPLAPADDAAVAFGVAVLMIIGLASLPVQRARLVISQ
jgi:hypothetical protein